VAIKDSQPYRIDVKENIHFVLNAIYQLVKPLILNMKIHLLHIIEDLPMNSGIMKEMEL
jgi:hypothetical protein